VPCGHFCSNASRAAPSASNGIGFGASWTLVLAQGFVLCFFLHGAFALVVVLGLVALHRVSIRTLEELS